MASGTEPRTSYSAMAPRSACLASRTLRSMGLKLDSSDSGSIFVLRRCSGDGAVFGDARSRDICPPVLATFRTTAPVRDESATTMTRVAVARAVSIVGHPVVLVFVAALISASGRGASLQQLRWIGGALATLG